jgi:D-glycero-D-manno-heptose 1,7-bisphosphate phosphatase
MVKLAEEAQPMADQSVKAVFLDRDGVVNRGVIREGKPYPPQSLDELELLPGVEGAVQALKESGYLIIIVTNQPDVRTGVQTLEVLELMHESLRRWLPIDDIKVCMHVDADNCACRKPKPGMLMEAARERDISLLDSYMIGDRWRDIQAGQAAGCATFFVDYGYNEPRPGPAGVVVSSLAEASRIILS